MRKFSNLKLFATLFIILLLSGINIAAAAIENPGNQQINEEEALEFTVTAPANVRVYIKNKPPGAVWNEVDRKFSFTPDFIQGGKSWNVILEAPEISSTVQFTVTVNDTISPPAPVIASTEALWQATLYRLKYTTDTYLDPPGLAGRVIDANVVVPNTASASQKYPLLIKLHGYDPNPATPIVGNGLLFGIATTDPGNTWWTGYSDTLPLPQGQAVSGGTVKNYSQRRVMHLLDYVINHFPGVDQDNINIEGSSMGAVGGIMISSKFARHFNIIQGNVGSAALSRLNAGQVQDHANKFFGARNLNLLDENGDNAWDAYDANAVALTNRDFRNIFFYQEYGQNDNLVPFKGVAQQSDLTNKSFSETLQDEGIGHLIAWDQRGHSTGEPAPYIYDWWFPLATMTADIDSYLKQLRRNRAFPAFSNSTADSAIAYYDTFGNIINSGALRGVINRYFRWDGNATTEDRNHVAIPIRVLVTQNGSPSHDPDFPVLGNEYFGPLPVITDVTIRRLTEFQLLPNETVNWTYGGQSGTAQANPDCSVTIRQLAVNNSNQTLEIRRATAPAAPDSKIEDTVSFLWKLNMLLRTFIFRLQL